MALHTFFVYCHTIFAALICCMHLFKSSQVKSSQRYLLQQDKYHIYNNIRGWNPFGFICLMNDQHSSYRKWPHFGDNNVSTSASTRAERSLKGTAQPPQAALRVFMLKTSSAASDNKADPTMTTPLQWITKMPKHSVWKYHRIYTTLENMPHVYQCSL